MSDEMQWFAIQAGSGAGAVAGLNLRALPIETLPRATYDHFIDAALSAKPKCPSLVFSTRLFLRMQVSIREPAISPYSAPSGGMATKANSDRGSLETNIFMNASFEN
jgi:hypothetical protein